MHIGWPILELDAPQSVAGHSNSRNHEGVQNAFSKFSQWNRPLELISGCALSKIFMKIYISLQQKSLKRRRQRETMSQAPRKIRVQVQKLSMYPEALIVARVRLDLTHADLRNQEHSEYLECQVYSRVLNKDRMHTEWSINNISCAIFQATHEPTRFTTIEMALSSKQRRTWASNGGRGCSVISMWMRHGLMNLWTYDVWAGTNIAYNDNTFKSHSKNDR